MADIFSKETRSKIMSCIRGKDTKPEIRLRKELFRRGYRYRLSYRFKEPNFTPDLVMVSRRTCIFIDGCFWHKCPKCFKKPKSKKRYWREKIDRNVERDKEQNAYLMANGWKIIRIWEHEVIKNLDLVIDRIINELEKG